MKLFDEPEMEVIRMEVEDVITTSNPTPGGDGLPIL